MEQEKIKTLKKQLRRLKNIRDEMEEEIGYIKSGIHSTENEIDQIKDEIKKLTTKK